MANESFVCYAKLFSMRRASYKWMYSFLYDQFICYAVLNYFLCAVRVINPPLCNFQINTKSVFQQIITLYIIIHFILIRKLTWQTFNYISGL